MSSSNDQLIGLPDPDADRDATAEEDDPYEGLIDSDVGHGDLHLRSHPAEVPRRD